MPERLRTVAWAQEQLGHTHVRSTRRWLVRHAVTVMRGKLLESEFYRAFRSKPFDPDALVAEMEF